MHLARPALSAFPGPLGALCARASQLQQLAAQLAQQTQVLAHGQASMFFSVRIDTVNGQPAAEQHAPELARQLLALVHGLLRTCVHCKRKNKKKRIKKRETKQEKREKREKEEE